MPRRTELVPRLAELLIGERVDAAFRATSGPQPGAELPLTLLPLAVGSWISWYLGLAFIGAICVAFGALRRNVVVASTEQGTVVCTIGRRTSRVLERFGEPVPEPTSSFGVSSIRLGTTRYWLRGVDEDEARRHARAAHRASTA